MIYLRIDIEQMKKLVLDCNIDELNQLEKYIQEVKSDFNNFNFTKNEYQMLCDSERISVIKSIRERTGLSLFTAKKLSEKWDSYIFYYENKRISAALDENK